MIRTLGYLLVAAFMIVAVQIDAWQWPVTTPVVVRGFGQFVDGAPLRGVDLLGSTGEVRGVAEGVVVSVSSRTVGPGAVHGASVVVEHADGYRSVYAYLDDDVRVAVGERVTAASVIGSIGASGYAPTRALRLSVFDAVRGVYVNPLLMLPALSDTVRPTVDRLFAIGERGVYDLISAPRLPPGLYDITAMVSDRIGPATSPSVIPYLVVFGTPEAQARFQFDAFRTDDVTVILPFRNVLPVHDAQGGLRLGSVRIADETVVLTVTVRDHVGNETTRTLRVEPEGPDEP